ncbi:dihydroorotase [Arachidicoccus rhizosphaerae]|uniref:Dihydroorotase n=1 Tax=Arachidicoccus rhizosphaerae TaxID=551991 RepID=A0A1H3XH16_9BACT|nr:dihydroorotase [Arachidicoccus rhizosphaerae]SDZ98510.1 dihydroorotase [Arachidicoccus rhizosphaerae]
MSDYLIKNAQIVSEGKTFISDVLIRNQRIEKIAPSLQVNFKVQEIDATGLYLLPGVIDDQVHFREPGLTHKAEIYTEARAAVAGGVTSFMEMPNTVPPAFTLELLEKKYDRAREVSLANYSFYLGTSNDNLEEIKKLNERKNEICGLKIFMGSSTGNLLVNDPIVLDNVFATSEVLIATHCEEESIIRANYEKLKAEKGILEPADHPVIRNAENCFESSFKAIQFAQKHNSRLHILHITTEKELQLFSNMLPLEQKRITCEVCVHHLIFTAEDYATKGYLIKCNPAIKEGFNKDALWKALLDDRLDVIATDHAPHLLSEKGYLRNEKGKLVPSDTATYENSHAGLPLVQHSLALMLGYVKEGKITIEKVVEKMSHAVARCFQIKDRGFIKEGYFADLVLVNMDNPTSVTPESLYSKCGWSPFEGETMGVTIEKTFVNGHLVYGNQGFDESIKGQRLSFNR